VKILEALLCFHSITGQLQFAVHKPFQIRSFSLLFLLLLLLLLIIICLFLNFAGGSQ
jgi:uncharacterized membrane protein